jgi:TetR/AcrR family fatty acid metabolism transcriptional regulator
VAAKLFASHRFHEARMDDIAAAAEVGKGTLYRYFKDKEELYMALLARASEEVPRQLRCAVEKATGPRARLEAYVAAVFVICDEQPHLLELIQHAEALLRSGKEFTWNKARQQSVEMIRQVLADADQAGEFHVPDPELATLLFLGSLRSVIRFGPKQRADDLPRRIVDMFLDGAVQPPAG